MWPKMIREWDDFRRSPWKDAWIYLIFTLVGSLLPIWFGLIAYLASKQEVALGAFADQGEFALYSAALLAPSLYLTFKDYRSTYLLGRVWFGLICTVLLLVSAGFFTWVLLARVGKFELDYSLLRLMTICIFIGTVVISFFLTGFDNTRSGIDIRKEKDRKYRDFESEFDRLG